MVKQEKKHIVIIGSGFAGINAAKKLKKTDALEIRERILVSLEKADQIDSP